MSDSPYLLKGQNALVTGASSGIGEAAARSLAKAGAAVTVNYYLEFRLKTTCSLKSLDSKN
jgi:glucose 1-dehydrogenase